MLNIYLLPPHVVDLIQGARLVMPCNILGTVCLFDTQLADLLFISFLDVLIRSRSPRLGRVPLLYRVQRLHWKTHCLDIQYRMLRESWTLQRFRNKVH